MDLANIQGGFNSNKDNQTQHQTKQYRSVQGQNQMDHRANEFEPFDQQDDFQEQQMDGSQGYLRLSQKIHGVADFVHTQNYQSNGQANANNVSPTKGTQWQNQTASTRYKTSSSQNVMDNDAPRIDEDMDFVTEQALDYINLNNQMQDNSRNDREGGGEDHHDFNDGFPDDSQPKQYIPYNMRKQRYINSDQQDFEQFMQHNQQFNQAEQFDHIQNQPKFMEQQNEIPDNLNMNQQNFGGSIPNRNSISQTNNQIKDNNYRNLNSDDQITVEVEMIDSGNHIRGTSSANSIDSQSSSQKNQQMSQDNGPGAGAQLKSRQKNTKDDVMQPQISIKQKDCNEAVVDFAKNKQMSRNQSSSHSNEREVEEEEEQSLNDRQEEATDEQESHANARSEKISNKDGSASDDDDDNDDDEDETGSLDSIDKLQNILNEINDQCIEHLKNEETDQALENLKRAEQILEDYTNEGKDVDRNMIIIVLYNQACCYQRLSMLDDCSNYLDGTIFNLQQKLLNFEEQEMEIRDMINDAEQYNQNTDRSKVRGRKLKSNTYGYGDEDDLDLGPEQNPYDVQNYDTYGINRGKTQVKKNYNMSSLSIQNKGKFNDGMSAAESQQSESIQNFEDLNDIQEPPEHYSINDPETLAEIESSKKLSISQKLFKLRYLCKCHLQLCAVQSQLNKHKDALHHGQMASIYCQELIRNSKVLCEGYIGELLTKKDNNQQQPNLQQINDDQQNQSEHSKEGDQDSKKSEKDNLGNKLKENYYLEDDAKLLDVLIKNCHPILTDMLKQIDNFNQYNEITENSKIAMVREQDILRGRRMEIANTEFDQDLMQLIESKEQYAISFEARKNIERFKIYEQDLKKKGYKSDKLLNQSSMKGDIFGPIDNEEITMSKKNPRKSLGKKQNNKQFVDEMAPNQIEFGRQSNPKQNREQEDREVYFKNDDQLNTSVNSTGTYGQYNHNFNSGGIGPQGYLNLRDNVKTVLVTQEEDDWIFNLNIGNVMHLQPLSSEQMNLHVDNSHELSRDAMLEKIILLTVSYFCVGTELRFLNNNSNSNDEKLDSKKNQQSDQDKDKKIKKELSEMWHAQALEASARFLPSECPLVAHVITNYQKHHSPALTIIPEDQELQEDLRVVRPLNEVKNDNINYYQIIRNHLKIERKQTKIKKTNIQSSPNKHSRNSAIKQPNLSPKKKTQGKIESAKITNVLTSNDQIPQPLATSPMAIQEPNRNNFFEKDKQEILQRVEINKNEKQNILVNDDMNQDDEAFSPEIFDGEEFANDINQADHVQIAHRDNHNQQINFYPQKDDINFGTGSSDDADAMIQLIEHREQVADNFQMMDQFDKQAHITNQQKLAVAKSVNTLQNTKVKKMPKSPASLQQSLSGTHFQNTQQFKMPNGMQFMQNKQDTQRSTGRIKIKKTNGGEGKFGTKKDSLAHRNQQTNNQGQVNSTGLTRIGSIKQRLKMMPSAKSSKTLKTGGQKKPITMTSHGGLAVKKTLNEGYKTNQSSAQLIKPRKSGQNIKNSQGLVSNTFASTSKLQTMKTFSPSAQNQITIGAGFGQANLSNNNPNGKKNMQSSKQLKQYISQGGQKTKPPTQSHGQQRKSSNNGQQQQMSIAQNIQKITQVLSQKISSMSQSLGTSSRQNSKARQEETPAEKQDNSHQQYNKTKDGKRRSSENQTNEISSDDEAEANIDGDNANDVSAERPGNGPAQKIRILHNVPKVSGSNLMIKSKASMNFSHSKGFMTIQNKNLNNQIRTGSGTRMASQGTFKAGLTNYQSALAQNQNQMSNKRLSIKVMNQKKNSIPVQDLNGLKINHNQIGKPPASHIQMQRTPQNNNTAQTRLMPSSVNNFSTQNNIYHRSLLQNQQQPQIAQSQNNFQVPRQQITPGSQGAINRKSIGSSGSANHHIEDKKQQIIIAQQNIKNIQSSLNHRNSIPGQRQQHLKHELNENNGNPLIDPDDGSPSQASNNLNNTNCNVTASLNNISGLSNILHNGASNQINLTSQHHPQQMFAQQKMNNQIMMQSTSMQQQMPQGGNPQQINRLPLSTQKFRQPMRIMKFKK